MASANPILMDGSWLNGTDSHHNNWIPAHEAIHSWIQDEIDMFNNSKLAYASNILDIAEENISFFKESYSGDCDSVWKQREIGFYTPNPGGLDG